MRVVGTAVIARAHLLKFIFSIDLSNCYSYNHVIMYTCDCQFHLNRAIWHLSSFSTKNGSDCEQVVFLTKQNVKKETVKIME